MGVHGFFSVKYLTDIMFLNFMSIRLNDLYKNPAWNSKTVHDLKVLYDYMVLGGLLPWE